jgi:predicted RNA-binding Zn-ribbon protein involved in translation (DUF1610 family)
VTIREYLRRRYSKVGLIAAPFAVLVLVAYHWLRDPLSYVVANLAVVGFFVVHVGLMWRTRCPKCGVALGKASYVSAHVSNASHCPHCGVSFDEPMSPAA